MCTLDVGTTWERRGVVAIHSDTYFRRLAEDHVRDTGVFEPPIPIEQVTERLGVPVRRANLPEFFKAALINEDGLPSILLNQALGERERREAFGHVVGHLLIVLADDDAEYPRANGDHHNADIVARSLVMPDGIVMDQARKWFNDHRYLAGLFGVSEEAMLDRMVELGLVSQKGIRWDY
jgi:Zn-dependent peptidase ImmA (M78 family)